MKLHPDKCTDPGAAEAFKRITFANEVLSNSSVRASHDQRGGESAAAMTAPAHAAHVAAASTRRHEDIQTEELQQALDQLVSFPRPIDDSQQLELEARARTTIKVRAALKAAAARAPPPASMRIVPWGRVPSERAAPRRLWLGRRAGWSGVAARREGAGRLRPREARRGNSSPGKAR